MKLAKCHHYTYQNGTQLDGHSFEVLNITEWNGMVTYVIFMHDTTYYVSQEAIDDYASKGQLRHDAI